MPFDFREMMASMSMATANIQEFNGDENEDASKWISQYQRVSRLWTDSAKVEQARSFLEGTAQYWYDDKIKPRLLTITYSEFKKEFLKKFMNTDKREFALRKLKTMTFNIQDHRVSNFITDYKHWNKLVNRDVAEKQLVSDLFERFPGNFQRKFLNISSLDTVENFDQFLGVALRVEKILRNKQAENNTCLKVNANPEKVTSNSEVVDGLSELLAEVRELRKELEIVKSKESKTNKRKKDCFKCGEEWPKCGCSSKCRRCPGQYPQCGCGKKPAQMLVDSTGNSKGPQA